MMRMLEQGLRCECVSLQACGGWALPGGAVMAASKGAA
jgi:hypothetical protein